MANYKKPPIAKNNINSLARYYNLTANKDNDKKVTMISNIMTPAEEAVNLSPADNKNYINDSYSISNPSIIHN